MNDDIYKELNFNDNNLISKKRIKTFENNIKKSRKIGKNSLNIIAKEVVKYIINSDKEIINLKNLDNSIKMTKRRLYDVTNVLQGKFYFYNFII